MSSRLAFPFLSHLHLAYSSQLGDTQVMLTFGEHQITPFQRTFQIGDQNVSTDVDISFAQSAIPSFEGTARLHFTCNIIDGTYTKKLRQYDWFDI